MHNLAVLAVLAPISGEHIPHQQSIINLNETAQSARKYAHELRNEFGLLSGLMEKSHPEAAARFNGLLNELILMTSVTANRAKNLAQGGGAES